MDIQLVQNYKLYYNNYQKNTVVISIAHSEY